MSANAPVKSIREVSQNGYKPIGTMPKSQQEPFVERIRRILPHREDIQMSDGRQIKGGIVIHPIIATALLGAVIAIGLSVRSEMSWQHDQIVKITTQKEDAEKRDAERAEELSKRLQNIDAVQIALGRDIVRAQEIQKAKNSRN